LSCKAGRAGQGRDRGGVGQGARQGRVGSAASAARHFQLR